MKNIKKLISLLTIISLIMTIPFTSLADDDEDYCYDESAFVMMTPEEVSGQMLQFGIGFDKMSTYSPNIIDREISVMANKTDGAIVVFFYTAGSTVANEIGVKNLRFYENDTLLRNDAKLYTGFQQAYSGGYYYYAPVSGRNYYAEGTNFAVFTYTERALFTTSGSLRY